MTTKHNTDGAARAIRRQQAAARASFKATRETMSMAGVDEGSAVIEGQQHTQAVRNAQHEQLNSTWPENYQHAIRLWTDHLHHIRPKLAEVVFFGDLASPKHSIRWQWSNIIDQYGEAILSTDRLDFESVHDANEHRTFWASMYGTLAEYAWNHMKRQTNFDQSLPPSENRVKISLPQDKEGNWQNSFGLLTFTEKWTDLPQATKEFLAASGHDADYMYIEAWLLRDESLARGWDVKRVDIGYPLQRADGTYHVPFDSEDAVARFGQYLPINAAQDKAYSLLRQEIINEKREEQAVSHKAKIFAVDGTPLGLPGLRSTVADAPEPETTEAEDNDHDLPREVVDDGHWPTPDPDQEYLDNLYEEGKKASAHIQTQNPFDPGYVADEIVDW